MLSIKHYKELNSTSVFAHKYLEELSNFDVISADIQSQGHGQFERYWYSTDTNGGNIYVSIILKPDNLAHIGELTRFIALIGAKTIENYGITTTFKYPNDILINGKKIAGFLAESEFIGQKCKGIIVGCGINLNLNEDDIKKIDIPATSIYLETGKNVDKEEFLNLFLSNFENEYDDFLANGIKGEMLC